MGHQNICVGGGFFNNRIGRHAAPRRPSLVCRSAVPRNHQKCSPRQWWPIRTCLGQQCHPQQALGPDVPLFFQYPVHNCACRLRQMRQPTLGAAETLAKHLFDPRIVFKPGGCKRLRARPFAGGCQHALFTPGNDGAAIICFSPPLPRPCRELRDVTPV